ncbi:hypothetical protein RND81_02G135500 [Saponaria officinalis]|uniref:BTB domain-containing protein n=1 Tax=Saponaria officinalis TaxID=3572 RepID=A0AAW1MTW4_SAPOF
MNGVVDNNMIQHRNVPIPPPLPCNATSSVCNKKVMDMFMAIVKAKETSVNSGTRDMWERLFDEAYRADVVVHTDNGGKIYGHSCILGMSSPVIRHMIKQSKRRGSRQRSISIRGVPHDAVRVFIRFLYSSCYDTNEIEEYILHLLILSHVYVVPHLKKECEKRLENGFLNVDNAMDVFQLALLCDAPRLSLICHRMILENFKAISATEGWQVMKESHPILEQEILASIAEADARQKEVVRKRNERKMYKQLYDAMEALVHICRDGCKTIGPHDKAPKEDEEPCTYSACKGLELLVRHFAACKHRIPGGCSHCKRMWKLLELHSRLCAHSETCRVPLCRNFKEKSRRHNKKEEMRWKILARNIVRSKSISGAPFFSLIATT